MVEVPEAQGDAAQVLESAVDRLNGPVGRAGVEVGEDLGPAFPHRPTQLAELLDPGRETFPDPAHHLVHPALPNPTAGMLVGCDDVLARPMRDIYSRVLFVVEHRIQLRFLLVGQQSHPGQQHPPHPVQGVA